MQGEKTSKVDKQSSEIKKEQDEEREGVSKDKPIGKAAMDAATVVINDTN